MVPGRGGIERVDFFENCWERYAEKKRDFAGKMENSEIHGVMTG